MGFTTPWGSAGGESRLPFCLGIKLIKNVIHISNVINVKYKYLPVHNIISDYMTSLTLSVSKELKAMMDKHQDINWSEVARQSIIQKLTLLAKMDRLLKNSKLTEKDAIDIGRKVNRGIARRLKMSE